MSYLQNVNKYTIQGVHKVPDPHITFEQIKELERGHIYMTPKEVIFGTTDNFTICPKNQVEGGGKNDSRAN